MKQLKALLLLSICLSTGCGGGGGGGGSSWSGPTNAQGFPDVHGTYRVTYSQVDYKCSDGTASTAPSRSENIAVAQSGNAIEFDSSANGFTAGFQVIRASKSTGTIGSDGDFSATRAIEGVVNQNISTAINFTINGQFFTSGFSGDLEYTAVFAQLNVSCTYNATFDASKIG